MTLVEVEIKTGEKLIINLDHISYYDFENNHVVFYGSSQIDLSPAGGEKLRKIVTMQRMTPIRVKNG